ncbi:hypothetical protein O181_047308 [Austropuccinia psidii MF-1]|uniref:Lysophospholipase n=1 Tax=Austropuccinia psidii MF-1 TaxID=1389203 RepID=A0A9Q3HJD4_9BASI|nr:hypothetical protein [Austropuccinia psidii MF-1]
MKSSLFYLRIGFLGFFYQLSKSSTFAKPNRTSTRAFVIETSPSGKYTPITEISDAEWEYLVKKASKAIPQWEEYLNRVNLVDFDIESFLSRAKSDEEGPILGQTLPSIAFAASGGGHRAMLYSASILAAFDGREAEAVAGGTGGILQLISWCSGLSGGAWLLGSWALSDFPRLSEMQEVWKLSHKYRLNSFYMEKNLLSYFFSMRKKKNAGFPVSLIENGSSNAKAVLFSSIRETPAYRNQEMPFPILLAVSRSKIRATLTLNSAIYEFSPENFAIGHPGLNASIDMKYLGTYPSSGGYLPTVCTEGTSSNVLSTYDSAEGQSSLFGRIAKKFGFEKIYEGLVPNIFKGLGVPGINPDFERQTLLLADGGFAGEKLPLFPLIRRNPDVIIASDATGGLKHAEGCKINPCLVKDNSNSISNQWYSDRSQWNLIVYDLHKAAGSFVQRVPVPYRPTFFGCDDSNVPLVIYMPNYYVLAKTDMKTTKSWFTAQEIEGFFRNGRAIATQTASEMSRNQAWSSCLACGLIERQRMRNEQPRTTQCSRCFEKYCAS